jgi:DNA-binding GntR family transcriptional regulator
MINPFRVTSLISHSRFEESVEEHSLIIDYILNGDSENAVKKDKEHLELAFKEIEIYLEKKGRI